MIRRNFRYDQIQEFLKPDLNNHQFEIDLEKYEKEIGKIPKMPYLKNKSVLAKVLEDIGFEMEVKQEVVKIETRVNKIIVKRKN